MNLEIGSYVQVTDCNGTKVNGSVVRILVNTVVIKNKGLRFLIAKSELAKQGYTFQLVKRESIYNTEICLAKRE